jgi:hypothetical protein
VDAAPAFLNNLCTSGIEFITKETDVHLISYVR